MPKRPASLAAPAAKKAPRKATVKAAAKAATAARGKAKAVAKPKPAKQAAPPSTPRDDKPLTTGERDRRFNLLLQTACLKAGSSAAVIGITRKVPLLGRLAPTLLGNVNESMSLGRLHHQLVRDVIALYDLELSDLEERGVILLATAVTENAHQLSRQMIERIVAQLGGRYLQPVASRILPLASLVTDIAGAIAGTYAVGKRAQALCNLPGTARNLADLLRGLSGIDERKLFSWSGEALRLALMPFRGVLGLRSVIKG